MNFLGVEKHVAHDRRMWKAVVARPTPIPDEKIWMLNENDDDIIFIKINK